MGILCNRYWESMPGRCTRFPDNVRIYVLTHVRRYVRAHAWTHADMQVRTYVYKYVDTHAHIYVRIGTTYVRTYSSWGYYGMDRTGDQGYGPWVIRGTGHVSIHSFLGGASPPQTTSKKQKKRPPARPLRSGLGLLW